MLCGRSWVQAAVCCARVAAGPGHVPLAMAPRPSPDTPPPTRRDTGPTTNSSASIHAGARAAGVANRAWAGLGLVLGSGADPAQHTPRPPPRQRPPMAPPPAAPQRHASDPVHTSPTVPMCARVCPAHGPAGTRHHAGRAAPPCPRPRVRPGLPDALPLVAASATRILALVSWAGSGRQPGPGAFCWCQTGSPPEHRHVGAASVLGSGIRHLGRCKTLDGTESRLWLEAGCVAEAVPADFLVRVSSRARTLGSRQPLSVPLRPGTVPPGEFPFPFPCP